MSLDQDALQDALSQDVDVAWLECLTFNHPDLSEPIRIVNDRVNLVRTAGTFLAFPFEVTLYQQSDESIAQARITADNVDQRIILELRAIQDDRPRVTYEAVRQTAPNTVIQGPMEFEIQGFVADVGTISLEVAFALDFLNQSFPKDYFTPGNVQS